MPFTLTMPKLSPTMEQGTIVKWHKKEGDPIKAGDLLFDVATDKATVEHTALDDGFLRKILITEGEEAIVNQAVAIFTEEKDEKIEGYHPEGAASTKNESVRKEDREKELLDSPLRASAATLQPTFPIEPPLEDYSFTYDLSFSSALKASPLAKKLAKEKGLELSGVKGSGPDGRVMSRDLNLAEPSSPVTFSHPSAPTLPPGSYIEEKLSPMRKAIGEKLQASKTFIPHFYMQQEVDCHNLHNLREELKATGIKITFNDFIIRAVAIALKKHPVINSGFDASKNVMVRFQTIDIAIAVSIEEGLVTPIIRHADFKNLGQISVEVKALAHLAKEGKLKPEQYRGGSFTISNLGMYGISDFQAVINPPQVSILAVGSIRDCPVIKEGQVMAGKQLTLSLSSDHRVVDGADAAKFLQTLKQYLEHPAILLL
ncbi:MAG: 2-oxo acid dehydrogenase subunit E2 [Simkania negevensis]|nr:2-oxo acid dehydrogenase subunit E2 [Simkania negevensis]